MSMDGVVAIYGSGDNKLVKKTRSATGQNQHRGRACAGIAIGTKKDIYIHKGLGSIDEVMDPEMLKAFQDLEPVAAIGNVGYTKNRIPEKRNAEPLEIHPKTNSKYKVAITLDGYLVDGDSLRSELEEDYNFHTTNKAEIIGALLHGAIEKNGISFEAGHEVVSKLSGRATFALTALVHDGKETYMVALNDDRAFEPFCFGNVNGAFVVSSESITHRALGGFMEREYAGAEMTICSSKGIDTKRVGESDIIMMPDGFQPVYFGHTGSMFQGKQIYDLRVLLGMGLVELYGVPLADKVIPNPDSGWGVTMGVFQGIQKRLLEEALDLSKYDSEGIIVVRDKKKYEQLMALDTVIPALVKQAQAVRTFQEGGGRVDTKFGAVDSLLRDIIALMGDDSTVRGSIAEKGSFWWVFNCGIKELLFFISYPPMYFPSFKEFHRGRECLDELAVQKAFKGKNPYDKSLDELNVGVANMFMRTLSKDFKDPQVKVFYNSPDNAKDILGNCSFQAIDASYPISEKFWPVWLRIEVEKYKLFH